MITVILFGMGAAVGVCCVAAIWPMLTYLLFGRPLTFTAIGAFFLAVLVVGLAFLITVNTPGVRPVLAPMWFGLLLISGLAAPLLVREVRTYQSAEA